jgi:alpha-tubulin suppressor-like RCC1 family protein
MKEHQFNLFETARRKTVKYLIARIGPISSKALYLALAQIYFVTILQGQTTTGPILVGLVQPDSSTNPVPVSLPGLPTVPPVAALWTDHGDYLPGTLATISGVGFQTNEWVVLQVLHADGTPSTGEDHEPWQVQADETGKLNTQWQVCEDDCLGSTLICAAVGQASSLTASVLFSDGNGPIDTITSGTVWAWGAGDSGQIGDGNYYYAVPSPVKVVAPAAWQGTKPVSIAAGGSTYTTSYCYQNGDCCQWCYSGDFFGGYYYCCSYCTYCYYNYYYYGHSLAVLDNGSVWAWGDGRYGQLGVNSFTIVGSPQPVFAPWAQTGQKAIAVAAGNFYSLFLLDNGNVWGTGYGYSGELGNGQATQTAVPIAVAAPAAWSGRKVIQIAAGDGNHSMAILDDGSIWAWGYNGYGQLGNGGTANALSPAPVSAPPAWAGKKAVSIATGAYHSLAVLEDGSIWAWGYSGYGQLGYGGTGSSSTPVPVSAPAAWAGQKAVAVAAGSIHSLALLDDGSVWAWGYNGYGQLGNGGYSQGLVPAQLSAPADWAGKKAVAITARNYQSLAALDDGSAWGWGFNYRGALGNGTYGNNYATPVVISAPSAWTGQKVVALAAGEYHTLGVLGVANQPPVANPIPDQSGTYGTSFSYSFPPNTFTDPDAGQMLSYTASGMPPGIAFDGSTRTFTGTPTAVGSYTVTVTATDNGTSPLSTSTSFKFNVAPAPLTIAADNKTKAYGASMVSFTATATGLVNGDTLASLNGTLTFTSTATASSPVGTYSIALGGLSSPNYTINFVAGSLSITPAALTITADNKSKGYGAPLPALTTSYSGLVNGDTPASLTTQPTVATTATASSPVGTYTITANGAVDANYTITYAPGTLTITPVSLVIAADSQSKAYGAALPVLTVSYSGFVNGDTPASLAALPAVITPGTAASSVGTYPLTASGALDANYTISYVPGTLTVTPVALTITADNKNKAYGAPLPALTVSYSGFVNGDTPASLTASPTATAAATAASSVGTYPITASGAIDANYMISYLPGTLTVTPVALTITADNKTKQYSDPLPAFTVSYDGLVNGDTPASLFGTLNVATPATMFSGPGSYTLTPSGLSSPNYTITYLNGTLTVTPEDARATYTGALFVGANSSGSATLTLSATIQDITAVIGNPAYDAYPGDISKATVTFVNRDNNTTIATVPVGLVNGSDSKTGTAMYNWNVNLGTADSIQFTIGIIVNAYYTRNASAEDAVVTVSKVSSGSVNGGGYLVLSYSSGLKAGDGGSKNNFGFNVKIGSNGPKGSINTIIRRTESDGVLHVYQIKGTAMTSLATKPNSTGGTATFNGKANIQDITNPLNAVSVDGNATLQVQMTDLGEPGSSDSIAITVFNKSGGVWFSSSWNGAQTVEQLLGGGNLLVR